MYSDSNNDVLFPYIKQKELINTKTSRVRKCSFVVFIFFILNLIIFYYHFDYFTIIPIAVTFISLIMTCFVFLFSYLIYHFDATDLELGKIDKKIKEDTSKLKIIADVFISQSILLLAFNLYSLVIAIIL